MRREPAMKKTMIVLALAAAALAGCGRTPEEPAKKPAASKSRYAAPYVKQAPPPQKFPLPGEIAGVANADMPPDVAQYMARQERCTLGGVDCGGNDAMLKRLRDRHRDDGKIIRALFKYGGENPTAKRMPKPAASGPQPIER